MICKTCWYGYLGTCFRCVQTDPVEIIKTKPKVKSLNQKKWHKKVHKKVEKDETLKAVIGVPDKKIVDSVEVVIKVPLVTRNYANKSRGVNNVSLANGKAWIKVGDKYVLHKDIIQWFKDSLAKE